MNVDQLIAVPRNARNIVFDSQEISIWFRILKDNGALSQIQFPIIH